MATGLSRYLVPTWSKQFRQFNAAQIARQLQAVMTSSFTKCNRITAGTEPESKWQRTASRTPSRNSSIVSP